MRTSLICLALPFLALSAQAQDRPPIETWAHRPLMEIVNDPDTALVPFTTDGCSGGMSELWTMAAQNLPGFAEANGDHPPWEQCCNVHDLAYYFAGGARTAEDSARARLTADRELRSCVEGTVSDGSRDAIAEAMYGAVRLGGGPCTAFSWRWGYGYPKCLLIPFPGVGD